MLLKIHKLRAKRNRKYHKIGKNFFNNKNKQINLNRNIQNIKNNLINL